MASRAWSARRLLCLHSCAVLREGYLGHIHLTQPETAHLPTTSTLRYIVGINQIYDVDIDVVNKPFLPVASGGGARTQLPACHQPSGRRA